MIIIFLVLAYIIPKINWGRVLVQLVLPEGISVLYKIKIKIKSYLVRRLRLLQRLLTVTTCICKY